MLLFLSHNSIQANPIKCDSIKVVFVDGIWPRSDDQESDNFNKMGYFSCELFLRDISSYSDSVLLTTSMYAFMRPMHVTLERQDGTSLQYLLSEPTKYMLKQEWTINQIGDGVLNANLRYGVEAVACYFYPLFQESNYPNIFLLDTNFGSWLPSSDEIDYSSCKINVTCDNPEKYLVFHTWEYEENEQPRFCITVVNQQKYRSRAYQVNGLEFNIFTVDDNGSQISPKFLNKLSDIPLPNNGIQTISIIEANWRGGDNGKEVSIGFGFSNYVICDPTFMDDSSIIHELLHVIFPIKTDRGKGHVFISESVIEWMAHYICYGKYQKLEETSFHRTTDLPIYEIASNDKDSWMQIYFLGPKYLQNLADKVGADRLYETIAAYYSEHTVELKYEDFIQHLIERFGREALTLDYKIRNGLSPIVFN